MLDSALKAHCAHNGVVADADASGRKATEHTRHCCNALKGTGGDDGEPVGGGGEVDAALMLERGDDGDGTGNKSSVPVNSPVPLQMRQLVATTQPNRQLAKCQTTYRLSLSLVVPMRLAVRFDVAMC